MCHLQVGDRIALKSFDEPRGIVMYNGDIPGTADGTWIGIDWDDMNRGKHNGSLNKIKYFNAR